MDKQQQASGAGVLFAYGVATLLVILMAMSVAKLALIWFT